MYGWLGLMTVILVGFIAILWEIFILPSPHHLFCSQTAVNLVLSLPAVLALHFLIYHQFVSS